VPETVSLSDLRNGEDHNKTTSEFTRIWMCVCGSHQQITDNMPPLDPTHQINNPARLPNFKNLTHVQESMVPNPVKRNIRYIATTCDKWNPSRLLTPRAGLGGAVAICLGTSPSALLWMLSGSSAGSGALVAYFERSLPATTKDDGFLFRHRK
jgi:hypothetical protein